MDITKSCCGGEATEFLGLSHGKGRMDDGGYFCTDMPPQGFGNGTLVRVILDIPYYTERQTSPLGLTRDTFPGAPWRACQY
jgi:hypothetical protein